MTSRHAIQPLDPTDPPPASRGPVRYWDDRIPSHRLVLAVLDRTPKWMRSRWPMDRFFMQPERIEWAKREAKRLMAALNWKEGE